MRIINDYNDNEDDDDDNNKIQTTTKNSSKLVRSHWVNYNP